MRKMILMSAMCISLFGVNLNTGIIQTKQDGINYEDQYARFVEAFDRTTVPALKKVSIHMIKATQDDLIMYCSKYIDISQYKLSEYVIDQEYKKYWGNTQ